MKLSEVRNEVNNLDISKKIQIKKKNDSYEYSTNICDKFSLFYFKLLRIIRRISILYIELYRIY